MDNVFMSVVKRLQFALELDSESALAEKLGLKQSAWSMRKTRKTLPKKEIDKLINELKLNAEWVYYGTGTVMPKDIDEGNLAERMKTRLQEIVAKERIYKYLHSQGWSKPVITKIIKGINNENSRLLHLIRDLHNYGGVDLHWLIADAEPAPKGTDYLFSFYRNATPEMRQAILKFAESVVFPPGKLPKYFPQ